MDELKKRQDETMEEYFKRVGINPELENEIIVDEEDLLKVDENGNIIEHPLLDENGILKEDYN